MHTSYAMRLTFWMRGHLDLQASSTACWWPCLRVQCLHIWCSRLRSVCVSCTAVGKAPQITPNKYHTSQCTRCNTCDSCFGTKFISIKDMMHSTPVLSQASNYSLHHLNMKSHPPLCFPITLFLTPASAPSDLIHLLLIANSHKPTLSLNQDEHIGTELHRLNDWDGSQVMAPSLSLSLTSFSAACLSLLPTSKPSAWYRLHHNTSCVQHDNIQQQQ